MKKLYLSILLATALTTPQTLFCAPPATRPQTWTAQDALGRTIGSTEQYGAPRPGKTVGMFFVIWHGTSGYDTYMKQLPDEGVRIPQPTDTLSPYDNQKLMTENPQNPQYGPQWVFHHWGEPYLGYYLADDDWVIRKHAQMLTDAGVDVIIVDLTNAVIYLPQLKNLCKVYTQIREAGGRTPQLSFIFNTQARETVQRLYDNFYAKGLYKDLWFYWKGKPLILCPPQDVTPQFADFFTIRHSWFCSLPEWEWFGDGRDKWPWADYYPQNAGWHESPDKPEAVSVAPATHPITDGGRVRRVGRSYHNGQQPDKAHQHSEQGLCFAEQFSRAMELDPEFVFFAGWNEWTAIRIINHNDFLKCGDRDLKEGDTYFWDLYNHEYSRDIEPLRGGFGDNYYYQLCDFIRRYKGVEPIEVHSDIHRIDPGDMTTWQQVKAVYADDRGDTFHRDHFGYGRIGQLINTTGRNDIVEAKMANDGKTLWFYVRTDRPITPCTDPKWMRLFIDVKGSELPDWEGFQYAVGNPAADGSKTALSRSRNGWNWEKIADLDYRVSDNEMVVAVPFAAIGMKNPKSFTVDFKWIDNAVDQGDIQQCLSDGDAAPNGRFRYRYIFEQQPDKTR